MDIYHFVRYYEGLSLDSLINKNESTAIICFDLEDSIQDVFDNTRNHELKACHRKLLQQILMPPQAEPDSLKIGVRINAGNTEEQNEDLNLLTGLQAVHTILLPKTENGEQIINLISELENRNISYIEIVPIVERKAGITNLKSIAGLQSSKITKIAFGHCDYNLDVEHFPFFHQNSREYWSWVEKITSIIKPYSLKFVNSPFLQLDNDLAFEQMLASLFSICGSDCGQIALTFKQAMACHENNGQAVPYYRKTANRLNMKARPSDASKFVSDFENENRNRGFTITEAKRIFLSPHEYFASINFLRKSDYPDFNFTFVGGCFPVQGNLLFEDLFHQLLKSKFEKQYRINFNVNIIRYERFKNCLEKIIQYADHNRIDRLVFCIRPEPILRLTKLSYKFIDGFGQVKRTFNLPFSKELDPENHDLLTLERSLVPPNRIEIAKNKFWTNINYLSGFLIGNNRVAMNKYLQLIKKIMLFCDDNNIPLLIMGPAIRTHTSVEAIISKKLEIFMKKRVHISADNYIKGSDLIDDGNKLFHDNGIHPNEHYHELIAGRFFNKLANTIEKMVGANNKIPIGRRKREYEH